MKIVLATPLYPPEIGGPATYADILMRELPKRGIEVALVKFSDVRHLPKLIRHIAYYRHVRNAARDADVIFALDPVSVGLPAMKAAQKLGKKFVVKIVGDYAWEQGSQRFGVTQNLDEFVKTPQSSWFVRRLQKIQTRVTQRATRVIVPSEYLKRIVSAWGTPADKIEVIYNNVEVPDVTATPREAGFLIMSAGRRVPWKGFRALERVVKREPHWRLFIASDMLRSELLSKIKSADVFVLNSTYEGLSHVLIEVMKIGTPVIATNVGGNPELVKHGETGLLISSGDDEALYAALKTVEADPAAARYRAAAGQAFVRDFSDERMVDKTAELLKSI